MTPAAKRALAELATNERAYKSGETERAWILPGTMGETRIFGALAKDGYASRRRGARDNFEYRITEKGMEVAGVTQKP
jgi:hypothetical protein